MIVTELYEKGIPVEVIKLLEQRGIKELTSAQEAAIRSGVLNGESIVISAPTSAGKTLIGELLAVQNARKGLTVFLASHKALARQLHGILTTRYVCDDVSYLKAGITTGDQDTVHGEWKRFDAIVSTYEKFYASFLSFKGFRTLLRTVVADELQIIGDEHRGHTAELLISRIISAKKERDIQIVGLSATVANSEALAEWLGAKHVNLIERQPPLEHEIWTYGKRTIYPPGVDSPRVARSNVVPSSIADVLRVVIEEGLEPIVIMASTKQKALNFAELAAGVYPIDEGFPLSVIEGFRAYDETPETTRKITGLLRRRIGVHHADLAPEQRAVVEDAFAAGQLRILSATTTLVAGVNLPIRTVIYPELTRWNRALNGDVFISIEEFRNGTGRAGRLGYHDKGTAIILADTQAVANVAKKMIFDPPTPVESRLGQRSHEWRLLHLLASQKIATIQQLADFASLTFWGHERRLDENEKMRNDVEARFRRVSEDPRWVLCWSQNGEKIHITESGMVIARSGLELSHVMEVYEEVKRFSGRMAKGAAVQQTQGEYIARVYLLPCMQDTLPGEARKRQNWSDHCQYVYNEYLHGKGIRPHHLQTVAIAHALYAASIHDYPSDVQEQMIEHRGERTWVAEALARLTRAAGSVAEVAAPQKMELAVHYLFRLADQLEYQIPAEAVPVKKVFMEFPVPNVGNKKIISLAGAIAGELCHILVMQDEQLGKIVGKKQIVPVRTAVLRYLSGLTKEQSARQLDEAKQDSEIEGLLDPLLRLQGRSFEQPVSDALRWLGWKVDLIDQRGSLASKSPDLKGYDDLGTPVIVECKTTADLAGEICEKDAMSLHKKAPEGFSGHALTVGRPVFSDAAIEAAIRSRGEWPRIRLVTAGALAEMILGVRFNGLPREKACNLLRTVTYLDVAKVISETYQVVPPRLRPRMTRRKKSKA